MKEFRRAVAEFYVRQLRKVKEPKLAMAATVRKFNVSRRSVYNYLRLHRKNCANSAPDSP